MNIKIDIRSKQRKLNYITLKLKTARDESNSVNVTKMIFFHMVRDYFIKTTFVTKK